MQVVGAVLDSRYPFVDYPDPAADPAADPAPMITMDRYVQMVQCASCNSDQAGTWGDVYTGGALAHVLGHNLFWLRRTDVSEDPTAGAINKELGQIVVFAVSHPYKTELPTVLLWHTGIYAETQNGQSAGVRNGFTDNHFQLLGVEKSGGFVEWRQPPMAMGVLCDLLIHVATAMMYELDDNNFIGSITTQRVLHIPRWMSLNGEAPQGTHPRSTP